jgi:hypothetical protein
VWRFPCACCGGAAAGRGVALQGLRVKARRIEAPADRCGGSSTGCVDRPPGPRIRQERTTRPQASAVYRPLPWRWPGLKAAQSPRSHARTSGSEKPHRSQGALGVRAKGRADVGCAGLEFQWLWTPRAQVAWRPYFRRTLIYAIA